MEVGWTLTWYRGSVLPYHSLWFTLMRVADLNQMKVKGLNDLMSKQGDLPSVMHERFVRTHHLGDEASIDRLAQTLGEPLSAFRWSHTAAVSQWTQSLFLSTPRVCPQCVLEGYHSALFSLKLLQTCPMHECEFMSACLCGENFPDRITDIACARGGNCGCGKFEFLSRKTCRQPTVDPTFTQPLDAVATWLDNISSVVRLPISELSGKHETLPAWISLIQQWCDLYGIDYPSCFIRPAETKKPMIVKRFGRPILKQSDFDTVRKTAITLEFGGHLKVHDAIYSSYSRHLRQHVAVDSHRWIRRFQKSGDPLEIAAWMRDSAQAYFAFAYMLWVHATDESRTWDFPAHGLSKHAPRNHKAESGRSGSTSVRLKSEKSSNQEAEQLAWLRGHRAISSLEQLWDVAIKRASQAVESGSATWGPLRSDPANSEVVVRGDEDGAMTLLELRAEPAKPIFEMKSRDGKARRISEARLQRAQSFSRLREETLELYHSFGGERWAQVEPQVPDGQLLRRWSLVDSGFHPHPFWLFSSENLYVARSRLAPLQESRDTAKDAIDALRESTIAYIVQNKIRLPRYLPPAARRRASPVAKAPSELAELIYRMDVAKIISSEGFWRAGALAAFHAKRLQDTRQPFQPEARNGYGPTP
jgi:hypothetical protein